MDDNENANCNDCPLREYCFCKRQSEGPSDGRGINLFTSCPFEEESSEGMVLIIPISLN